MIVFDFEVSILSKGFMTYGSSDQTSDVERVTDTHIYTRTYSPLSLTHLLIVPPHRSSTVLPNNSFLPLLSTETFNLS